MDQTIAKSIVAILSCGLIACCITRAHAQNKVVVIPMFGDGESVSDISNVVTVAKSGGDFTNPVDAMSSINNSSANNPYLIAIAPGNYTVDETLEPKGWVSLVGSGQSNTKILAGSGVSTTVEYSGITGVASISNLTIENSTGGSFCRGVYFDAGLILSDVTVIASDCNSNTAISIELNPNLKNVTAIARGGSSATGITVDQNPFGTFEDLDIEAAYADTNIGIQMSGSQDGDRLEIIDTTINAFGASFNANAIGTGIEISNVGKVKMRTSSVIGSTVSLFADPDASFTVSASSLVGGVGGGGNTGVKKCVNSDNGEGEELTSGCLEN